MSRTDGKSTLVDGHEKKGVAQVVVSAYELEINLKVADACPVKIIRVVSR